MPFFKDDLQYRSGAKETPVKRIQIDAGEVLRVFKFKDMVVFQPGLELFRRKGCWQLVDKLVCRHG